MHTNNLLLFLGVCLSILELLGFRYCKWIIYICTVYNFQVHEMDYQRLILAMKKKSLNTIKVCEHFSDDLLSIEQILHQALQNFSTALFERMIVAVYL